MWSAIVDRQGVLCSVINSNNDPWPGSRDIAIAKATTANGFSNSALALSTANLYGPTQPGGSLYGLNNSNPFNPWFNPQNTGIGFVPGGIITFGGGVALYQNGKVIGGLGVSGDTSCADHAIAYRMRHLAGLDGTPPGGVGPNGTDNINYYPAGLTRQSKPVRSAALHFHRYNPLVGRRGGGRIGQPVADGYATLAIGLSITTVPGPDLPGWNSPAFLWSHYASGDGGSARHRR